MKRITFSALIAVVVVIALFNQSCRKETHVAQEQDSTATMARSVSANPISYFERVTGDFICQGWAFDPDRPAGQIWMHFYQDGPAGGTGKFIGRVQTKDYRPDVNNFPAFAGYHLTGNHGFSFTIPASARTQGLHTIYAYAINVPQPDNNPLIGTQIYATKFTVQYRPSITGVSNNLISLDIHNSRPSTERRPVVIWVHGGAWMTGDKANQLTNKINLFKSLNYLLVSINYRLSPTDVNILDPNRIKYHIHNVDVATATWWVYNNIARYGGDKNNIALMGHSAGAHLVALNSVNTIFLPAFGMTPSQLKGVLCIDGDYDLLRNSIDNTDSLKAYIKNAFGENLSTLRLASPTFNINSTITYPRFLVTIRGSAARQQQARNFIDSLKTSGKAVVDIVPADQYNHDQINDAIGAPNDTVITPQIVTFLRNTVGL